MLQQLKYAAYVWREVLERCHTHYVTSIFFILVCSSTIGQNQHRLRSLRLHKHVEIYVIIVIIIITMRNW